MGMGGKGGDQASKVLEQISKESFQMGKPAMQQALGAFMEALGTGRLGAREPEIGQAVERSMQASNQAEQTMAEDLSRTGIAGTPFAMSILGPMRQQAAQQAALIPTQMRTEDFWKALSLFFPGAGQSMQAGIGGMGTAAQTEAQRYAAQSQLFGQLFSAPFQSLEFTKALSSKELKQDIQFLDPKECLDKVCALQGVKYTWKATGDLDAGLIAEEVANVIGEASGSLNGYAAVSPMALIGYLVESVKALRAEVEELRR